MSGTDRSGFERSLSSWYSGFLLPQFQGPDLLRRRKRLVLVASSDFFESDFPLTVGVVAESLVVMRGSGLPLASVGARDPVVRFHEGHSPPLLDQMVFHSESSTLVGQVRSSFIGGSWWCIFLVAISVVLGCVEFCWAGDPSFLDFNVFATNQRSWNIKKSLSAVNSLPYPIIQPVYSSSANSSSFSQLCLITPTSLTMSNLHQQPRPCPYSRPVRFTVVNPYPPPPYRPVASHRYGLRPRLPLPNGRVVAGSRLRPIPEQPVMPSPIAIPPVLPVAPILSPVRAAIRPSFSVAGSFGLRAGLGNPFTPRTPVRPPPVQSVDTPEWSFRVNRPDPFSPSSPINPFVVDRGTPETPPVRVRPSVGGSQALSNLTRVLVDRGATPPPAPRPRNASTPPSFESSPVAARWSSPSGASAVAGSSSGTPAPTRVTTPPVQGAYDPDDYHLLQRDQICLLLAPAPPLAPYD
ncbi:hypothetical protein Pst134EB_029558 [Puccinia striiformis f. sp. tritici]|nr:hypothetical protein Pst134EB_029558 [Puccinia striiformis f. sp. tritici]